MRTKRQSIKGGGWEEAGGERDKERVTRRSKKTDRNRDGVGKGRER